LKKKLLILCLAVVLFLSGCSKQKQALNGTYIALNPPVASGEMVIQKLEFDNNKVTMISGNVSQTVTYSLEEDKFLIATNYGAFSYSFSQTADGEFIIDGVTYQRQ